VRRDDRIRQREHRIPVGDVDRVRTEPIGCGPGELGGLGEAVGVEIDRGDPRATREQGEHDLTADAVAAAGDHERLVLDFHHASSSIGAPERDSMVLARRRGWKSNAV
jgi:hypothetical protein